MIDNNFQNIKSGVSYNQLLNIEVGKDLILLSDASGLYRQILWVHYLENPNYIEFLNGEDLILTTAYTIEKKEDFLNLLYKLNEKNIAGLVISDKDELENAFYLEDGIKLANKLHIPIFQLPWKIAMSDLTNSLCRAIIENERKSFSINHFFHNIIYSRRLNNNDLELARELGYNPQLDYFSFILEYDDDNLDIRNSNNHKNLILEKILNIVDNNKLSFIYTIDNNKLLSMVASQSNVSFYPEDFIKLILNEFPELLLKNISMAIGSYFQELNSFKDSILQALLCLDNKIEGKNIYEFQKLPIYQLIYYMKDLSILEESFNITLKNLIIYDKDNNTNLINTLKVYLQNDKHLQNTANDLFIHINTLRYRLQRIEEILKLDLKDSETVFNLRLIFQIEHFIK